MKTRGNEPTTDAEASSGTPTTGADAATASSQLAGREWPLEIGIEEHRGGVQGRGLGLMKLNEGEGLGHRHRIAIGLSFECFSPSRNLGIH